MLQQLRSVRHATVRFRVDMSNEEVSPFGVHVAGSFQDTQDPGAIELTDPDGDMVYESVQTFDAMDMTSIEYKFINGNTWADPNEFVDGECGNEFGNRELTLDSENIVLAADATGAAYCYGSCTACGAVGHVHGGHECGGKCVTWEVHLAGSFQGWDPAGTPLMDNGDGTWAVAEVPRVRTNSSSSHNAWDGNEENMEVVATTAGTASPRLTT